MVLSSYIARACAALPLLGLLAPTCQASPVPTVATRTIPTLHGNVTGSVAKGIVRYTVPYAEPPVGQCRLTAAREMGAWDSLDGSHLPLPCLQAGVKSSEDCLYMNIYTPGGARPQTNLSVMVWIHGGSFYEGTPNDIDDGARWFSQYQHVVVVTVQYRLGLLGWLRDFGYEGNQGLTDAIQALKFVQSDIRAYGGDPDKVTLAGQSSGAEIIKTLLVTDSADTLFHGAILQSAPIDYPDQSLATARTISFQAAGDLGCMRRAWRCFREKTGQELLDEQFSILNTAIQEQKWSHLADFSFAEPFRVHIDGKLVTKDFRQVVASGQPLNVPSRPLLFTSVKDEGCNGVRQVLSQPQPAAYWSAIAGSVIPMYFPTRANRIMSSGAYDPSQLTNDDDAVRDELIALTTDFSWVCPIQQTALNATAANGYTGNVWLGEFDIGVSKFAPGATGGCDGGVGHQDDIKLIFGPKNSSEYTYAQNAVIAEVQDRWASFIRTGNPGAASLRWPAWPPVAASKNDLNVLVFGADARTGKSAVKKSQRDGICKMPGGVYTPR